MATTCAALLLGACGSSSPQTNAVHAAYQLHMEFFSHESGLGTVIDPQMFIASPGAPAQIGPQMIPHVAGLMPVAHDAPSSTPLLDANGRPLDVTLGAWEKATGTLTLTCSKNVEAAKSQLTGLLPRSLYSVFVVHLKVDGPGRFTPFGNPAGTDDSFTSTRSGKAITTDHVNGCLDHQEAVVVIWHSDGKTHGAAPGILGLTWHNSVITQVP